MLRAILGALIGAIISFFLQIYTLPNKFPWNEPITMVTLGMLGAMLGMIFLLIIE